MDIARFKEFMRDDKKSERTVSRYAEFIENITTYFQQHQSGKSIDLITSNDLKDFESWAEFNLNSINQHLWALKVYAEYSGNHELEMLASELLGIRYSKGYKLKEFLGVNKEEVATLNSLGIKTVSALLEAGKTKAGRKKLAKESGLSPDSILELVKLSDLARIPGLKKIRARLYYEAGLDTIEKIARFDSQELVRYLTEFINTTGFDGIAPVPKEAVSTVAIAKHIPRIIEL